MASASEKVDDLKKELTEHRVSVAKVLGGIESDSKTMLTMLKEIKDDKKDIYKHIARSDKRISVLEDARNSKTSRVKTILSVLTPIGVAILGYFLMRK